MSAFPGPTHAVENQASPLQDYNLFDGDDALRSAVQAQGAGWATEELSRLGGKLGRRAFIELGELANTRLPELRAFDRFGHRINEVRFHDAYHTLMTTSVAEGLHAMPWTEKTAGAWVARLAKCYLMTQIEQGHGCPVTMTFAAIPALRWQPDLHDRWFAKITSRTYDQRSIPAARKSGLTVGMAMTEKQGGSDVRSNSTVAVADGGGWRLTGHKWFCSAPMCDLFLTLANTDKGLTCFVVPRFTDDGARNGMNLQRLKDKLGNQSNASSEVEFVGAWAEMVGEEGRGVRTIIDMVAHTRLDCVTGSAAVMRAAVSQAIWHTSHRKAFGKVLIDQPLMRNVLADLALDAEAAMALGMRLGRAYEDGLTNEDSAAFARIATAASKFHVCKRAPELVYEALECHGGNGFVQEAPIARLYREAPLNSVWEGSGNVICLDVLRAMVREPRSVEMLVDELRAAGGSDNRYDQFVDHLTDELRDGADLEYRARRVVEAIGLGLQASVLIQTAPNSVADAFISGRLANRCTRSYGTLAPGTDVELLIARATPATAA